MRLRLGLFTCATLVACGGQDEATTVSSQPTTATCDPGRGAIVERDGFRRYTVDDAAKGAAYVSIADMNGDGRKDLVVSTFDEYTRDGSAVALKPGRITVYHQGASGLGCWSKREIVGPEQGLYFPNQTTIADLDGDGDLDVVVPAGFFVCAFDKAVRTCGSLAWFENDRGAWRRHDVVPPNGPAFYHKAVVVDFDGDGVDDLVTVAETNAKTRWFKGDRSADRFGKTPLEIGDGGGSLPVVADVDGDGDLDVASAEFFVSGGSFAWFERTGAPSATSPAGTWVRHLIAGDLGKSIMFDLVPDLFGDGKLRAIGTNHTNTNPAAESPDTIESAVFAFEVPADPRTPWEATAISTGIMSGPRSGQGAPGVFGWGDVDGDGDVDLAVSGDGDPRTFWLEQTSPGVFETHVLEPDNGQAGGGVVVDLDGDGSNEIVFTGYEKSAVYVYARSK